MEIEHTYPSISDCEEISKRFDFSRFRIIENEPNILENGDLIKRIKIKFVLPTWKLNLRNRLTDVQKCFIFVQFYFEKGIPDDDWFVSPGKEGYSVSYYPNFNEQHFSNKINFNFYADVFYYKLFSVWDTLGQILKLIYDLKSPKKIYFESSVNELVYVNDALYEELKGIIEDVQYKRAKQIRNDMAHNFLPNHVGSPLIEEKDDDNKTKLLFGVGKYTTAKELVENIYKSLDLICETLEIIFAV